MSAAAPTVATPPRAGRFWRRGLRIALLIGAISTTVALAFSQSFWTTFVYSASIATGCWFFIDSGRILTARWQQRALPAEQRASWPGWRAMVLILVVGTALGYSAGNAFANFVLGMDNAGLVASDPRQAFAMLLFALVPGVGVTYFFYSRAQVAKTEARALAAQREAAEHQLRLLESQLEPHMLFNTLANLRALIATDPQRAQKMLDQLIAFLRATLAASRTGVHSLEAEFARLADYLALMQIRMGARLATRLDLPADLARHALPALLLQPLVENAIRHGIEPKIDGGRVEVGAARDGDTLVLRVRDTGVGLASPAAAGAERQAPGGGFGLTQVRERLATLYGNAASLMLETPDDAEGGTLATLRLPLR